MVCHADGVPATKDCTVCHADKVASHYDPAKHAATFGSINMTILGTSYGSHSCDECHGTSDLRAVHTVTGGGCATCHPTPASSVKPWNKSCATGGCHTSGPDAQHTQIDSAHVTGAHTCFTDGCHDNGGSLASIHWRQGCSVCHTPGQTPSADCTTCHDTTNPHGDLESIHTATSDPQSMIFFDGSTQHANNEGTGEVDVTTDCTMCHSTNLMVQHRYAPCSTCHQGAAPADQFDNGWNGTCQQGDCHSGDIHLTASDGHGNQAYQQDCNTCHAHEGDGDWPNSSRDWCGECHGRPRDLEPPVTTSDAVGTYTGGTAVITLSATDVDGWIRWTAYSVDGGPIETNDAGGDPALTTVQVTGVGSHTLEFWSVDGPYHAEDRNTVEFTIQ
jgi:hypothetical protein